MEIFREGKVNYLKILDDTLKSLEKHTDKNPLPKEVLLQRINLLDKLSNRDIRLVFDKLKADGFIDVMDSIGLDSYFITFNGLLLLQNGGYEKKQSIINTNLNFKKILNAFLLIASVLGSIYTVIQIKEAFCKNIGLQPVSIRVINNSK